MHENTLLAYIISLIVGLSLFITCTSNNYRPADDDVGRAAVSAISKLETELEYLDRRVIDITTRAEDIAGDVDVVEELLREYTRYVQQLRSTVAEYRARVEAKAEASD